MGTTYYRSLLDPQGKTAYDAMIAGFRGYETRIKLPVIPADTVNRALNAARLDNPALFFLGSNIVIHSSVLKTELEIDYRYTQAEARQLLDRLNRIAAEAVSKTRGMRDHEVATFLHDYLVERITYSDSNNRRNEAHTIVGALICHSCVCEGFAKAYKFLCDKAGVPSMVVTGTAWGSDGIPEPHAWNILKIGQTCCHVDVTFDQYVDKAYCSRSYLFISDQEARTNHTIDPEFSVPNCPRSFLPMVRVAGVEGFLEAVRKDQRKNLRYSEYALNSYVDPKAFTDAFIKKLSILDIILHNRIGGFFYSDSRTVNVIGVKWR